jgi:hypothetical protein
MSTHYVPSAREFHAGATEHYSFLCQRYGFSLVSRLDDDQEFIVRFRAGLLQVVVEGMSYGFVLGTRIERHSPGSDSPEVIQLHSLMELRRPELLVSRYPERRGQLEDMKFDSIALREVASDFLSGDLSDWTRLHAVAHATEERRGVEAIEQMCRHDLDRASARAAEAFRNGEFQKAVEILAPFEAELSPSQVTKLKMARKRARGAA